MSAVLNRDAVAGYQRWEPPQVGSAAAPAPSPAPAEPANHPTVSNLEALERQAREEGHAAGLAQGLAEARAQGRERVARLDSICAQAARPLEALDAAVEQELAQLALLVARRVIAQELAARPELIVQAVRQAVAALPAATRELRVRLHPDDLALMRELEAAETHWQLVADPALKRGGCLLESEHSRLDAQLEPRLDRTTGPPPPARAGRAHAHCRRPPAPRGRPDARGRRLRSGARCALPGGHRRRQPARYRGRRLRGRTPAADARRRDARRVAERPRSSACPCRRPAGRRQPARPRGRRRWRAAGWRGAAG